MRRVLPLTVKLLLLAALVSHLRTSTAVRLAEALLPANQQYMKGVLSAVQQRHLLRVTPPGTTANPQSHGPSPSGGSTPPPAAAAASPVVSAALTSASGNPSTPPPAAVQSSPPPPPAAAASPAPTAAVITPGNPSAPVAAGTSTSRSSGPVTTQPAEGGPAVAAQGESQTAAAPGSADGCQYIKGLQFEGQLSAFDGGFKLTEFSVANIKRFVGVKATYWEIQAADSPQACCQLCQANNRTFATAVLAVPSPTAPLGTKKVQQRGWMNTDAMKDPCLYFTWVPIPSASATSTSADAADAAVAAAQQQRRAGGRQTGDGSVAGAGTTAVVAGTDGFSDSTAGALNQGGACLLIGGGMGWVDAEASKSGFNTVSGLLYTG